METYASSAQLIYFGCIICFALAEFYRPDRRPSQDFLLRWRTHACLGTLTWGLGRIMAPIGIAIAATYAQNLSWGITRLDGGVPVILGLLVLDLYKYWEHRLLHEVRPLWRLHATHHSDVDIDFTTGLRHHPGEVLVNGLVMPAVVLAAGIPLSAVILYSIFASVTSIYTHANVAWPHRLERALRSVFVTRDLHLIHHSADAVETDSNYGQVLIVWDRLFGSFTAEPRGGLHGMTTGLDFIAPADTTSLRHTLAMPFHIKPRAAYSVAP